MSLPTDDLNVWVLAGQSNMQGCGPLCEALPPDADVHCFSSAGAWEPAQEPLHRLWESYAPVHQNLMRPNLAEEMRDWTDEQLARHAAENGKGGAGLGLSFGMEMARFTGRPVGLIPAAHGGTSLEQWSQERKSQGLHSLYGAMLDRIRRAGGNLRGVLWYQGESDASPELSASYAPRFEAWVAALRADLQRPDLPVIVVQLGRFVLAEEPAAAAESWDRVRYSQAELPERVPYTAVTSALDLPLSDAIHIGTPGLIRLGRRLARLAQALEMGEAYSGPRLDRVTAAAGPLGAAVLEVHCTGVTGRWSPAHHAAGFQVWNPDGSAHGNLRVVDVSADAGDGTVLRVLLTGTLTEPVLLTYGRGLNPYCNVVDEADMPLLAFRALAQPQAG